jgi:hypothetical protein
VNLLDDLANFLRRNFAGSNPAAAADTLISQAAPPPDPASSPAAAMAAAQVGARPLNADEKPTPLAPAATNAVRPPNGGLTPEFAMRTGLNMMAGSGPPAAPPMTPTPVAPAHTAQPAADLVQAVFPQDQRPALNDRQRQLLRMFPGFGGYGSR